VSVATTNEMDAVVTWNCHHLANIRRRELFIAASLEKGYVRPLAIVTPMEVAEHED
jgi:hypothetical protein